MRRLLLIAALAAVACGARTPREETFPQLRERVSALAQVQAEYMDSLLTAEMAGRASTGWRCPRTFQGDTLVTSDIGWWCSGFYPGVLWQIFEETEDPRFMRLAVRHTLPLAGLLDRETDHDIGFQLMSSFGKMALDLPSDGPAGLSECNEKERSPKDVLAQGAETLAARFIPEAGVLRSWNGSRWNIPVIIDNMMNLDLLMVYGDREVAEKHALTTAANHFREDGTTWHLVDYADDGSILGKQTVQGYADDSAWARGQAWALYGYAQMAQREREAGNEALSQQFYGIAAKLEGWMLPRLPEDGVPYWDFSQNDLRDASAGAILACGFLRMWNLRGCPADDPAFAMAERILRTLASPEYLAEPGTNGGFLLKHSVGSLPGHSEVDVPLTYADYYFLEALMQYPYAD
jgi:hypothetical protein